MELMSKQTFCELLSKTVDKICTSLLLQSAFSSTGLFPFNADNFDYSKLLTITNESNNADRDETSTDGAENDQRLFQQLENLIETTLPGRLDEFRKAGEHDNVENPL